VAVPAESTQKGRGLFWRSARGAGETPRRMWTPRVSLPVDTGADEVADTETKNLYASQPTPITPATMRMYKPNTAKPTRATTTRLNPAPPDLRRRRAMPPTLLLLFF